MRLGKRPGTMLWRVLMVTVLAIGVALPAGASQHEGVIDATVTVGLSEACILLSTSVLDFGTLNLGEQSDPVPYSVGKCNTASQDLYVMGTHATLSDNVTSWQLTDEYGPVNEYWLAAHDRSNPGSGVTPFAVLSASTAKLLISDMPTQSDVDTTVATPPVGSDGAGQVASFQIIWIAVLSG